MRVDEGGRDELPGQVEAEVGGGVHVGAGDEAVLEVEVVLPALAAGVDQAGVLEDRFHRLPTSRV